MNTLSVTVADGKYTVLQDEFGRLSALRYGQEWRNCLGDGLILALAQEVERLREQYDQKVAEPAMQELVFQVQAEENYQKLLAAEEVIAELKKEVDALKQREKQLEDEVVELHKFRTLPTEGPLLTKEQYMDYQWSELVDMCIRLNRERQQIEQLTLESRLPEERLLAERVRFLCKIHEMWNEDFRKRLEVSLTKEKQ